MQPASPLMQIHHVVAAADGELLTLIECAVEGGQAPVNGPVFLLIHGFTGDRNVFTRGPLPAAFNRLGARVYVGELRGRSRGSKDRAPGTIGAYLSLDCEAFLAFLSRLAEPQGVHFVGHSLGGLLGCYMLRDKRIASLTTIGTPLSIPRLASPLRPLGPVASALLQLQPDSYQVPWNQLLKAFAHSLCTSDAGWPARKLRQWVGLANPESADPEALLHILKNSHTESASLFLELIEMLSGGTLSLCGAEPIEAVRNSTLPVAAVVGTWDPLAPPYSVAGLRKGDHLGPRRIVAVQASGHFDLPLGHYMPTVATHLWKFLCQPSPRHKEASQPPSHGQS